MQAWPMLSCGVHPSVTFIHSVKTSNRILRLLSPSGSRTSLVFPYQTSWQYSIGDTRNRGVECRQQKSRSQPISGSIACCERFDCQVQYSAATDHGKLMTLVAGKRRCLFMARDDDKVFMTRSFNVRP